MLATTQADAPFSQHINNRGGQQQQQYYQGNYQGNYRNNQNRGRRRGRNNNYCGCGRNNWNNNQSGWVQQPSAWQSQPLQQYWQQQNWQQNQQQWHPGPMAYQVTTTPSSSADILGPFQQSANNQPLIPTTIPQNLAQAFGTMTLQEPQDSGWYFDSGATAHFTFQPGTLCSLFNSSNTPFILVDNGTSLPTSTIGFHYIPTIKRHLHLNNILVCLSIIKNLISVHQFTKNNWVSIEFDPFGFLVKDLTTQNQCSDVTAPDLSTPLMSRLQHLLLRKLFFLLLQAPRCGIVVLATPAIMYCNLFYILI